MSEVTDVGFPNDTQVSPSGRSFVTLLDVSGHGSGFMKSDKHAKEICAGTLNFLLAALHDAQGLFADELLSPALQLSPTMRLKPTPQVRQEFMSLPGDRKRLRVQHLQQGVEILFFEVSSFLEVDLE